MRDATRLNRKSRHRIKRNQMKASVLIFLLILTMMWSGYSEPGPNGKISIVCTLFPQYDWVRQILGDQTDHVDITLLLRNRIDLHNYQPSVDDIVKISSCDLFVYVGGESDGWVTHALKQATNHPMAVINLLNTLGDAAKEEHETEYDEHVWLSLKNARTFCPVIADALSSLDTGNAEVYQSNLAAYIEKLSSLDSEYQAAVNAAPVKTLLFGDRFPFRYLMDDYGLHCYTVFTGCSAEAEASFATLIFLAGKMDELSLKSIIVTESSDQSIARTIRNNTAAVNQKILVLDAMQSVAPIDIQNGATYLSIMESNLNVLKEALR